jgi:hypothetical protein
MIKDFALSLLSMQNRFQRGCLCGSFLEQLATTTTIRDCRFTSEVTAALTGELQACTCSCVGTREKN